MTTVDPRPVLSPRAKRWTKREYNALVETGAFKRQRLFLYRGDLIELSQMTSDHAWTVANFTRWLFDEFHEVYRVAIRCPFETPGESMPEPDGAVYSPEHWLHWPHPNQAHFVVEVSDVTLDLDREKAFDYAAAGVPEYWIVDVVSRSIEIYREPTADASTILGLRYVSRRVAGEEDSIAPLLRPDAEVTAKSFLATT